MNQEKVGFLNMFARYQPSETLENAFSQAAVHYRAAEEEFPEECYGPLEHCYSAMEDYKQAYEYACKRRKGGVPC